MHELAVAHLCVNDVNSNGGVDSVNVGFQSLTLEYYVLELRLRYHQRFNLKLYTFAHIATPFNLFHNDPP